MSVNDILTFKTKLMKSLFLCVTCVAATFSCSKNDSTDGPIIIDRGIDSFELVLSPIIAPDAED
jgi:hypothetical protein